MESYYYLIKSVFIWNTGVGKSSIIDCYIHNTFDPIHIPTIGVEFFSTFFKQDKLNIKLHIWDLAGHIHFRNIIRSYYRHAKIIFFVFDKTDRKSFQDFEGWIENFRYRLEEIQLVIIGNKSDLSYVSITEQEGLNLANQYKALYFETSVKNNSNIDTIFSTTMKHIQDKIINKDSAFHPDLFESNKVQNGGFEVIKLDKIDKKPIKNYCC